MNVRQVLPPDAIPSVDDPEFVGVAEYGGDDGDEVVVLEPETGPARAYPVRYLNYHEIVNDVLPGGDGEGDPGEGPAGDAAGGDPPAGDGDPVAVTWCPLCGSAVAYSRRVGDRVLEFGVSGKLADDDLVMYDRETESEWKQSLGRAIAGEYEGTDLRALAAPMTTLRAFRAAHPDGLVLAPPGRREAGDGPEGDPAAGYDDRPYREYFEGEGFGLAARRGGEGDREWDRTDLAPKAVVLGVERGGEALGFPLERVAAAGGVVAAEVGGDRVVVATTPDGIFAYEAPPGPVEPAGSTAAEGEASADGTESEGDDGAGSENGADDAAGGTGRPRRFAADGTVWDATTGEGADGRRLERVPARRLFAFAWQDDHGPDAFFESA